uniref:ORF103 n=1 Tax=Malaco herpesvirus 1 TaxID=3031797 RepID=A0AA48P7U3_9VIRU|nr:TPA_asm: ORF103 [Malaco herpesvirus 1]
MATASATAPLISFEDEQPPSYEEVFFGRAATTPDAPRTPPSYEESVWAPIETPPNYARSEGENTITSPCVRCSVTTNRVILRCNHVLCMTCVKEVDACTKCNLPFDDFSHLEKIEILTLPCKHQMTLMDFMGFNIERRGPSLRCFDCFLMVTGYEILHSETTLTPNGLRYEEFREMARDSMKTHMDALKYDCEVRDDHCSVYAHIWRKLRLVGQDKPNAFLNNMSSYCGFCDHTKIDNSVSFFRSDCCSRLICHFCIKNLATEIGHMKLRCPMCHNKNFLTNQNGLTVCGKQFKLVLKQNALCEKQEEFCNALP